MITNNGGNQIGGQQFGPPINPMLGPLADNLGPTKTHALLPGSPAIDTGHPVFIIFPPIDQRGEPFARVFNGDGIGKRTGRYRVVRAAATSAVLDGRFFPRWRVQTQRITSCGGKPWVLDVPKYSGADGDGDGVVDQDDYGVWRAHFGLTLPGAGSGAGAATAADFGELPAASSGSELVEDSRVRPVAPDAQALETIAQAGIANADELPASRDQGEPNRSVEPRGLHVELLAPRSSLPASFRPSRRPFGIEPAVAASRRDACALAWLASPDRERRSEAFEEANTRKNEDESNTTDGQLESLDEVFALLMSE